MRKTRVPSHHQEKCQRSAPQSAQKCVPQKASLLNSVLGENLERAACHDQEELECQRSAPRCAWATTRSVLLPTVPLTAAREGHGEQEILGTSMTCSAIGRSRIRKASVTESTRSIENLHEGADIGEMLHTVPLNTVLSARNLRQRCWPAPVGLFFEAEELRLGCGDLPDLRRVVLLVPPHPGPGILQTP